MDIARRIVLQARHDATIVDPSTVYSLVVRITGSQEWGDPQATYVYRIGRTPSQQVVMQLQKRGFSRWAEDRVVDHAPVLDLASKDVLEVIALDMASSCCGPDHLELDDSTELLNLICRCELKPSSGKGEGMEILEKIDVCLDSYNLEEMETRRKNVVNMLQAQIEKMVGVYRAVQHNVSF